MMSASKPAAAHGGTKAKPHKGNQNDAKSRAKEKHMKAHGGKAGSGAKKVAADMAVQSALRSIKSPMSMKTDEKTGFVQVSREVAGSRDLLRAALGPNGYRTHLTLLGSDVAGSSGTAIASALPADMVGCAEFAGFAALFDEVRCVAVDTCVWVIQSAGTLGSVTNTLAILVWDADDGTAPSSVAALCTHVRRDGPFNIGVTSNGVQFPPVALRRQGLQVSSGTLPTMGFPTVSGGAPVDGPVRGEWISTASSNVIVGYYKLYIEAQAGVTFTRRVFTRYLVEYRMRM
jgi:hypothetical protein